MCVCLSTHTHMDIYIHISTNSNAIYSMKEVSPNSNLAIIL